MASYNKPILIQKLDEETEKWSDYYSTHANINKASEIKSIEICLAIFFHLFP